MSQIKAPKKLIEVALPLDAISAGCEQEKNPFLKNHPRSVHLWWARRPLAAARAVIFAQMVNDPGYERSLGRGVNKEKAAAERERLFKLIEELVQWDGMTNEELLNRARDEIKKSWIETCALNRNHPQAADLFNPERLPAFHDPFSGGGALPLEAQRLGMEAFASDLNPVAVTINKAMIEVPPRFSSQKPIGPRKSKEKQRDLVEDWNGAKGLAEDVRRYGAWMREEVERRIGTLYPPVIVTAAMAETRSDLKPLVGKSLKVIAWLWARTVKSPNPAFSHVDVPLASTFALSTKAGKEAYISPIVDGDKYRFTVLLGTPPDHLLEGTKLSRGANFRCLLSSSPIEPKHIYNEAKAGRMGSRLMAIVAEGPGGRGRVYLPPTDEHQAVASSVNPEWKPEVAMPDNPRWFSPPLYGLRTYGDLFTPRQLVALTTLCDLVGEAIEKCRKDALSAGLPDDAVSLEDGGAGATAYAQAIGLYLACGVSQLSRYSCTVCGWNKTNENVAQAFGRQAIPMVWDFAESNPIDGSLDISSTIEWPASAIQSLGKSGGATQQDAQNQTLTQNKVVSTDPPYYDNIGYADLSDFFYVWLRRALRPMFPSIFATLAVPKAEELVATPYRHGGADAAERFFLDGMKRAIKGLAEQAHPAFPVTIYYAFKQSETKAESGTSSTGWETFLQAVVDAGFAITGTWPMRTERTKGLKGSVNALASSIVLVCRRRSEDATSISRREYIRELNSALPEALDEMTRGGINSPVAPVDLSQAIIGPGMAIFSEHAAVLEADGTPMSVKTALQLINRFLAEDDFDHDTQFCLHWFEQQGWATGKFGDADVLARAKGTAVSGLQATGVVESGKGDLRLLRWAELPRDWSPETDTRLPVWEALHHLIRALNQDGESAAGVLLARMPARAEPIRALAYRLYTLCERKGWPDDARAYNELVNAWSAIEQAAGEAGVVGSQAQLDI